MSASNLEFRVWDSVENRYIGKLEDDFFFISEYGELFIFGKNEQGKFALLEADTSRFIVERCTGLKDKDGTIIYEGDILEMKRHVFLEEFKVERYAVEYSQMLARWRLGKSCIYLNKDTAAECKIVGNVHENAELLEVKK